MKRNMKQELNYSTREINKNFKMKVYGRNEEGKKVDTLMGVSGLILLIGVDMMNKQLDRAFRSKEDKCVCKLRRGIQVTYYVK
jgi:hypothetical protein